MKLPFLDWFLPTKKNDYTPRLLRKGAFVVYTILILLTNMLSGTFSTPTAAGAVSAVELITLCNQERVAAGLDSLNSNSKLASAAQAKAANMFEVQYWDHYGPNGETPWQFITAAGYSYVYAGENLAKGFTTSEGVHSAWMASQSHRENIMNANYKDIGIAVVPGTLLGENVILVVQLFGAMSVLSETDQEEPPVQDDVDDGSSLPQTSDNIPYEEEEIDDSLEITYPQDGDVINTGDFVMEGTSGVSEQDIEIFNNEKLLGEAICQEGVWDFKPENSWSDGEYDVYAQGSVAGKSDSVGFEVDTTAPIISSDTLEVTYDVGILNVSVTIDGNPSLVGMVVGEKESTMEEIEPGIFEGSVLVTSSDITGKCEIVAADEAGNSSTLGIRDEIEKLVNAVEEGESSIKSFSSIFNYLIIFGVAVLFIVDLFYLYKLKKVESQGKILFKSALWIIILAITLLVGTTGTIS